MHYKFHEIWTIGNPVLVVSSINNQDIGLVISESHKILYNNIIIYYIIKYIIIYHIIQYNKVYNII